MRYYIGIDGGGTKTQYALFDENRTMLDSVKTEGSNHENLEGAIPAAADIIMSGVNALLAKNNLTIDDITHTLMALAGIDHVYQHDEMRVELDQRGMKNYSVYNDGFIVIKAGADNGVGIGYNCGAGTCCNSVDSDGKMLQVGGFGELSGDMGNGHWIATQTFRLLYDDICLKARKTKLTELAIANFGIAAERDSLLGLIARLENEKEAENTIRTLIDIFFEAAALGDEPTLSVIRMMAERGAEYIVAHLKNQNFVCDPVNVVLSGSIHTKLPSDIYKNLLKERTEAISGRKFKFITLDVPPVTGCINWMLEENFGG
ncbi:MAG: hypothetical protein IJC45_04210 [Clostridia bacterium]|nr:hypothetical protein [Clostridia bacterium]